MTGFFNTRQLIDRIRSLDHLGAFSPHLELVEQELDGCADAMAYWYSGAVCEREGCDWIFAGDGLLACSRCEAERPYGVATG